MAASYGAKVDVLDDIDNALNMLINGYQAEWRDRLLRLGESADPQEVQDYINILQAYGNTIGAPVMKHLDGEIWELRPLRDRVLFAGVVGGRYVLLHQFVKKTQKTPKREIEQAKRELEDFKRRSDLYE